MRIVQQNGKGRDFGKTKSHPVGLRNKNQFFDCRRNSRRCAVKRVTGSVRVKSRVGQAAGAKSALGGIIQ